MKMQKGILNLFSFNTKINAFYSSYILNMIVLSYQALLIRIFLKTSSYIVVRYRSNYKR
jgi:hypothetical protein